MDSAAYLFPGISQITQLFPTPRSVITLGQLSNVPLMCPASELVDGSEPHDYIHPATRTRGGMQTGHRVQWRVYPGWSGGVPGGCYTGY